MALTNQQLEQQRMMQEQQRLMQEQQRQQQMKMQQEAERQRLIQQQQEENRRRQQQLTNQLKNENPNQNNYLIKEEKIGGTGYSAPKKAEPKQETVKASGQNTAVKATAGTVATRDKSANAAYKESQAVLDARKAMQQAQKGQPTYTESQAVLDAQNALQSLQDSRPQGYNSKYGEALDELMAQIQNPGTYNYEFNGDNLFKQYADMYTQQGKQAAMNAMGNAAALTGGYGNSYGQMAANQAYDQYLTQLYDRGMDLRDRDYQVWLDEQQNKYNQYNLMANADQTDYGRYRDTVTDWQADRDYATGRYDTERNYDYSKYRDTVSDWQNNRDYYTNQYNTETDRDYSRYSDARNFAEQQYQYDTEMKEKIREFDESLNWEKMSSQQKYAAEYCMSALAKGQMPTADMLKAAGLSTKDAQKIMTQKSSGGGGGGGNSGKKGGLISDGIVYDDGKGGFTDANGKPVKLTDYDRGSVTIVTNGQNGIPNSGLEFNDPDEEKEWQDYKNGKK